MFNFGFGFVGGMYLGTYHNSTCKPIIDRLYDCVIYEFNRKLNEIESKDKDTNNKDN